MAGRVSRAGLSLVGTSRVGAGPVADPVVVAEMRAALGRMRSEPEVWAYARGAMGELFRLVTDALQAGDVNAVRFLVGRGLAMDAATDAELRERWNFGTSGGAA